MSEEIDTRAECPRMTPEEIRTLSGRIVRNEVWIGLDRESLQGFDAFLMLAGGAPYREVGALWEDMRHASTWAVNGCPMFLSIGGFVHIQDGPILLREIRAMMRATGMPVPSEEEIDAARQRLEARRIDS